jgi:hypothetical protein
VQQSEFLPHWNVFAKQSCGTQVLAPDGPAQMPEQHWSDWPQEAPSANPQLPGGPQRCVVWLHEASQQSERTAHEPPFAAHVAETHVPEVWPDATKQFPEQQSPSAVHAPSSGARVQACGVEVSLFFLQPVAASARTASADTRSVESLDVRMESSDGAATDAGARAGPGVSHGFPAPAM